MRTTKVKSMPSSLVKSALPSLGLSVFLSEQAVAWLKSRTQTQHTRLKVCDVYYPPNANGVSSRKYKQVSCQQSVLGFYSTTRLKGR